MFCQAGLSKQKIKGIVSDETKSLCITVEANSSTYLVKTHFIKLQRNLYFHVLMSGQLQLWALFSRPEGVCLQELQKTVVCVTFFGSSVICSDCNYFSGVRVFIPNFVQIDKLDCKENLKKIENAGVLFPMSKFTNKYY